MTKATQKKLLQAIETCKGMLASTGWSAASWLPVRQQMNQLQKMLPEDAGSVTEIITSLQQALQALPKKMETDTAQETRDLVRDLLVAAADRVASFPVKKLFVFLPYKASMWDSLESIWRAAAADKEHCETLVIPIPYCDRDKDMSAKEWHCEANSFPSDIPVEDWRKYRLADLEQLHPDVIFIHNPYDELNTVTSVDSDYYSSNLKRCTDNLVYVPYFVSGDTIAPHFCQTRGVVNADHVIVESEKIRKQYEQYYPLGTPPEGKILALGSPKFDKVLGYTKEDFDLPAAWKKLLRGKKAILYNTSISAVLQNTDAFAPKLRKVLAFFRQQKDVVLWWRPHPLLAATFQSMRPDQYEIYRQLVEAYRSEGWGVYDDTPDFDRALVCTDAYYGDLSSAVWLYQATGKKLLLQELGDLRFQPYIFNDVFFDASHDRWIVKPYMRNGLLQFSMETGEAHVLSDYSAMPIMQEAIPLFRDLATYQDGDRLYLLPLYTTVLRWYDTRDSAWHETDLARHPGIQSDAMIMGARRYRDHLYFWGMSYGMIEYDPEKEEVIAIYDFEGRETPLLGAYLELNVACFVGSKLYLPLYNICGFAVFDCETKQGQYQTLGDQPVYFADIETDGKSLWLLAQLPLFVHYDLSTGASQVYPLDEGLPMKTYPYYVNLFLLQDKLLIFPCDNDPRIEDVLLLDIKTGKRQRYHHPGGYFEVRRLPDGTFAAIDVRRSQIDLYDVTGAYLRTVELHYDAPLMQDWENQYAVDGNRVLFELWDMSLEKFLQKIAFKKLPIPKVEKNAGQRIYDAFKN